MKKLVSKLCFSIIQLVLLYAWEVAAVERARASGVCTLNEFRLQMGLHAWWGCVQVESSQTHSFVKAPGDQPLNL